MSSHSKIIRETLLAPIIDNLKQITAQIEAIASEEENLENLNEIRESLQQALSQVSVVILVLEHTDLLVTLSNIKMYDVEEHLDITNMKLSEILSAVAQRRIQQYPSLREAADSLGIDVRTLQKYAQWQEPDNEKEENASGATHLKG